MGSLLVDYWSLYWQLYNKDTRTVCAIGSKLTIKALNQTNLTSIQQTPIRHQNNLWNSFKVDNKNSQTMCKCFLKLTTKKTEQWMNLFKVKSKDLTNMWGICSKLTIKTLDQCMKIVQSNIKDTIKMCEIYSNSTISTLEICFILLLFVRSQQ